MHDASTLAGFSAAARLAAATAARRVRKKYQQWVFAYPLKSTWVDNHDKQYRVLWNVWSSMRFSSTTCDCSTNVLRTCVTFVVWALRSSITWAGWLQSGRVSVTICTLSAFILHCTSVTGSVSPTGLQERVSSLYTGPSPRWHSSPA